MLIKFYVFLPFVFLGVEINLDSSMGNLYWQYASSEIENEKDSDCSKLKLIMLPVLIKLDRSI